MRSWVLSFGAIACLAAAPAMAQGNSGGQGCNQSDTVLPDGFSDFLVYMGTGALDLTTTPNNQQTGCSGGFCDGNYFHTVVMGRSPAEMAALTADAKAFFLTRYGIDVDVEQAAGRVLFFTWEFDDRVQYRNYIAAGQKIYSGGHLVRDGGWQVLVIDPAGITLGGEFPGVHVPPGSFALWGNYNILRTKPNGEPKSEDIIYYRAGSFVNVDDLGEGHFICELSRTDPQFSNGNEGFAQGTIRVQFQSPTVQKINLRNVITFGASNPAPGLGPDGPQGTCGQ